MFHSAFPVSKKEGKIKKEKKIDKLNLSHLADNKRNGPAEMRNLSNIMEGAQSLLSIAKNRMPGFILHQRPLLIDMPLL